jgi:hypothetical protein
VFTVWPLCTQMAMVRVLVLVQCETGSINFRVCFISGNTRITVFRSVDLDYQILPFNRRSDISPHGLGAVL